MNNGIAVIVPQKYEYASLSMSMSSHIRDVTLLLDAIASSKQWRIVGYRGAGARDSVGDLCKCVTKRFISGGLGGCKPQRGAGQSPGGKAILATYILKIG